MEFYKHPNLVGKHAFLSPSTHSWINYDEAKLVERYSNFLATQRGTELHEFAATCIKLGQKLPASKKTLNMYVNDAIGFKMTPEQPLYYSDNAFGTTDAICFRKEFLRIHDYKSGVTPASMHQLEIYEALFCLEYRIDPFSIGSELRLYQMDEIIVSNPEPSDIKDIMNQIITFDKLITNMKVEAN